MLPAPLLFSPAVTSLQLPKQDFKEPLHSHWYTQALNAKQKQDWLDIGCYPSERHPQQCSYTSLQQGGSIRFPGLLEICWLTLIFRIMGFRGWGDASICEILATQAWWFEYRFPSTLIKSQEQVDTTIIFSLGGTDRYRLLGGHWPASLDELKKSKFSERFCQPLTSAQECIWTTTHTCTFMHTYTIHTN